MSGAVAWLDTSSKCWGVASELQAWVSPHHGTRGWRCKLKQWVTEAVLMGDGSRQNGSLLALSSVDRRKCYFLFLEMLILIFRDGLLMPLVMHLFYVPYLNNESTPALDLQVEKKSNGALHLIVLESEGT